MRIKISRKTVIVLRDRERLQDNEGILEEMQGSIHQTNKKIYSTYSKVGD